MTVKHSAHNGGYIKAVLLSGFLLCFILISVKGLYAEEPLPLATRSSIPPYVYGPASSGMEIDLLNAIFKEMKLRVKYVQLPRVRMVQSFNRGEMKGILTQAPSVSGVGCAADWYIEHRNVGFSLQENNIQLHRLHDLKSLSVISFDGATLYLGPAFKAAVSNNSRYTESRNQQSHIDLLYKKRFDVVVGDEWILRLAQRRIFDQTGGKQALTVHNIMKPALYSARFHEKSLCERFNTALAHLRSSGDYDAILEGYHLRINVAIAPTSK
ncbi:MAG: hypothetical protein JKY34_13745 [Kordiimonadaceae bacterium]|nr:hypothetical protein [Kordiimonadaceae bacterium]